VFKESEIRKLKNLGPVSEKRLNSVGIYTRQDLEKVGPKSAFDLIKRAGFHPTVNLLYALVGAINGEHWVEVAKNIKIEEIFK